MRELQECLNTKRHIDKIDEKITELKVAVYSPKNQIITGMPRSGNNENAIEKYLIKLERLKKKKAELLKQQSELWESIKEKTGDISEQEQYLLYIRCVEGYPWQKCCKIMQSKYGKWNVNKCFRIYGKINKII